MLKNLPILKLSREEEDYLRHWIYDEIHYQEGPGPAKRLQVERQVPPADLAVLIAATWPDHADQEAAAMPLAAPVRWPWSAEALRGRLQEARTLLGLGHSGEQTPARS